MFFSSGAAARDARSGSGSGSLPPGQMVATLSATVAGIDHLLALQQVQSMNDVVSGVEVPRRFSHHPHHQLLRSAPCCRLGPGIYAIDAFSVSLRSQEIAIRMALGAQGAGIARLRLTSGAKLSMLGCVLGVMGSYAASRLPASFLFDMSAIDPWIYLFASLTIMGMAILASTLPAKRAASPDPMHAVRAN